MSSDSSEKRVVGVPFQKGKSGNPGGRPKGLAEYIRKQTRGGKDLVDLWLKILRAEGEFAKADINDRIRASHELADRGFGKAIETHDVLGLNFQPIVTVVLHAHEAHRVELH